MRNKLLTFIFCLFCVSAQAAQENMVHTKLLLDGSNLQSGDTAWGAVQFTIPAGWHIYWQNPGDAGIPTKLTWTLPEGVDAGDIQWPAAERQVMGDLVNYGYSDEVVLPVPLLVSRDGAAGSVSVKADWLVCHDTCIPESAVLEGALPHTDATEALLIKTARDSVPAPFPGKASFAADDKKVVLTLEPSGQWESPRRAEFIPLEDGIIPNNSVPTIRSFDNRIALEFVRGSADLPPSWHGTAWLEWAGKPPVAYDVDADLGAALPVAPPDAQPLLLILGLAFLGGLLLNIMPCVLPILSLKALALVKKAGLSRPAVRMQGLSYTIGVVLSFLLIAGIMLALKASGEAVGWGFQLQSPATVFALILLMLAVSANLMDLFHLPPVLGRVMVDDHGLRGSFLTGVLAVAVATPCTAPFMATAVGATLALPASLSLLVFASMGLGMASPFLLISLWPMLQRLLPKPGHWMHTFRRILALPVFLTALWLVYVFVLLVHPQPMRQRGEYDILRPIPYSENRLNELRAANVPVFVDATAAWCLTCKLNERVALHPDATERYFEQHGVRLMIADWTTRDAEIAAYLATFGRNGVPLYVFYPPGKPPIVLPQLLTPALVVDTLKASLP